MKITFLFLLLFSFSVLGQNLVPNPGFENYVTPPCSWLGDQASMSAAVEDWLVLSGTPDLFNNLVPTACYANCFSTDYYAWGHQQPHSGDFMAGIMTFGAGMMAPSQYREAFQVPLTSPLTVGAQYYVEMYVSLGESSSFASNNIGFYFSESPITSTGWTPLHYTPHVVETNIIADTTNWVKVSGTFIADEPAEYLFIANFTDDSLTNAYHFNNTFRKVAAYFIDDILVKETCLSVCNNKTICLNDSTVISASSNSFNGWALENDPSVVLSTDSLFTVSPSTTTTYLALSDCDTFSVTVFVQSDVPELFLGNDTTICEGQLLALKAADPNGIYEWQDGSSEASFTVTSAGNYWLRETNKCGTSFSEIQVAISPLPDISSVPEWFCAGEPIMLHEIDTSLYAYQMDTTSGNMIVSAVIDEPGMYNLYAHNACGGSSKNIIIEIVDCQDEIELPNIITPNGDHVNDLFVPVKRDHIVAMKTVLFNRWGESIYETTNPDIAWDGASYTEGVYFWRIEYTTELGVQKSRQGFFELVK